MVELFDACLPRIEVFKLLFINRLLRTQPDNASWSSGSFSPLDDVSVKNAVYYNQKDERNNIENSREHGADL